MAIIYEEDFASGNSLFGTVYRYNRTGVSSEAQDPLYPFMWVAEGVNINGDGRLDKNPTYTGPFETYQQAGFWVKSMGALDGGGSGVYSGSGFWDGTVGWMEARYHPTTESLGVLNEEFVFAPMISIVTPASFTLLSVIANLFDATLQVNHSNSGSHDFEVTLVGAPMPVAGEPYLVRMEWQCGTVNEELEADPDGFMRVWINDELIYEATNLSLLLAFQTDPPNLIDSATLGYFGLLGPLEYFTINDSAYPTAAVVNFESGAVERPLVWMKILHKEVP